MSVTQKYQDFGKKYAEAWSSHHPEKVASMFCPEGSIIVNGSLPAVGRVAVAEVAQEYMLAFPDLEVRCTEVTIKDGAIQWNWHMKGTNSGPFGSGRKIDISGYETIILNENGFIVSANGYYDEEDFNRQISRLE